MRHFIRRTFILLLTLWTAVTLNFFIPRLMPGNPAEAILAKFQSKGNLSEASVHALEVMFGINTHQTMLQQYWQYWREVFRFDFGLSYTYYPQTVSSLIAQALPWTLILIGVTTVIGFIGGTLLGIFAAWRNGTKTDAILTLTSTITQIFPYFWFALLCVYFLAFLLHIFPLSQGYSADFMPGWDTGFILSAIYHSILPALTILVTSVGGWLLGMRNNMISVLSEDYITLGKAKGLSNTTVALQYAARNAILPSLTGFALNLGFIVGGNVLVEVVFAYPGLGNLLFTAVTNEDYPLMQAIFLIIVVCVVLANFVADLVNVLIDPRIRRAGG
ncbi:ABC transporter permease [Alicyclobacillus dauci]|uniref:ABC transporter permease n=1 Tax=Alicyclobacillus dauci TaxID=1475485 RepID=A0ABY6Z348_9BACL|nr:ABC transporter permease [Alicyclobacillus dauci]WAH37180.1 ABC transporter permease [Alicyclobacillus dauci]